MSKRHSEHSEAPPETQDDGPESVVELYTAAKAVVRAAGASGLIGPLTSRLQDAVVRFEKAAGHAMKEAS